MSELGIRVVAGLYLGVSYHNSGDYLRAVDCYTTTLASLEGQPIQERFGLVAVAAVLTKAYLAYSLAEVGRYVEGCACGEEAVRIAEAVSHPYSQIWANNWLGYLYLRSGGPAIEVLERALALCSDTGTRIGFPFAASYLGAAHTMVGHLDRAIPLLEQAVDAGVSMKFPMAQALRLCLLGEAYVSARRVADAFNAAGRALTQSRDYKERGNEAWAIRLLGEIHSEEDPINFKAAQASYDQAIALAQELGMRPLVAHCHSGLARLYRRVGDQAGSETHLATATKIYRELGSTFWLTRVEAMIGAESSVRP